MFWMALNPIRAAQALQGTYGQRPDILRDGIVKPVDKPLPASSVTSVSSD